MQKTQAEPERRKRQDRGVVDPRVADRLVQRAGAEKRRDQGRDGDEGRRSRPDALEHFGLLLKSARYVFVGEVLCFLVSRGHGASKLRPAPVGPQVRYRPLSRYQTVLPSRPQRSSTPSRVRAPVT